ncbi:hypothetical protein PHYC_02494 [Phycisphaerales bacterium]|nr:hypothetical protein PHYC_02494 [Phycisphaerales bacterium]
MLNAARTSSRHPATPRRASRKPWYRLRLHRLGVFLLVILGLLVAARIALPHYLQSYVNRVLDQSTAYDGRIGTIDVSLWRGAYTIHDIAIVKTANSVPVPFFEAPRLDLALDWPSLLHGKARGRVVMFQPQINFVHGPTPEESQTGVAQPWLGMLNDLFPFRIDRAEIKDGQVHFHAFHTRPPVDVFVTELQAELTNLTNVRDTIEPLIATLHASGNAMRSGRFEMDLKLDPAAHRPSFNLAARLLDVDARELNELTQAYGGFDFETGRFDFVIEADSKDGFMEGYAKPLFRDARVIGFQDLEESGPVSALWEGMVSVVGQAFTNPLRNQFGTRVTIQGDLDDPQMSILEILGNILYNAFVQAFLPRIEGRYAPDIADVLDTTKQEGSTP